MALALKSNLYDISMVTAYSFSIFMLYCFPFSHPGLLYFYIQDIFPIGTIQLDF